MKHYVFRSTTDKLPEHMQHIIESGDTVVGEPTWVGGRDWVLLCRQGAATVTDLSRDEFVMAVAEGVKLGIEASQGRRDGRMRRVAP